MIKSELIQAIAKKIPSRSITVVEDAVNILLEHMSSTLSQDGRIEVRGFGAFSLRHHKARMARNPKTGVKVPVPAKAIPHFKAGKELRERVNAGS